MKKKLNINRFLENSKRSDVRGYNIYTRGVSEDARDKFDKYFEKWDKPYPGLKGEISFGHQINVKDAAVPVIYLNGRVQTFSVTRNHWTPAYMTTYYRSEPEGEYKKSGLLGMREDKCFTEDDIFISHITLINDDRRPCDVRIEISVPFVRIGDGIYHVEAETAVGGLLKSLSVNGYAAVKTDKGASANITIAPNSRAYLRYGFCFDRTSPNSAEKRLSAALGIDNPFTESEERFNRWMDENIPEFYTDNTDILKVYCYRAFLIKCAIHNPSEIIDDSVFKGECVYESPFGGWFGSPIGLPIPLQIEEMKWMKNTAPLRSHIKNWCENRGISQAYIQYTPMAVWHLYLQTGDKSIVEEAYSACRKYTLVKSTDDRFELPVTVGSWVTGAEYQPPFYQFTEPEWDWRNDSEFEHEGFMKTSLIRCDESSMYAANLRACANMASLLGLAEDEKILCEYAEAAEKKIIKLCWNEEKQFFFDVDAKSGKQCDKAYSYDGYLPMLWDLADERYHSAFDKLAEESGFACEFGMTSVDKACPMYWFDNCITGPYNADLENPHFYGCCWNGPVWPYAFSQVLDSLGKASRTTESMKSLWLNMFLQYTDLHFDYGDRSTPCICEHYRPSDGMSFSPVTDYFHSEWMNLLFSHWAGIRVTEDGFDFVPFTDDEFIIENVVIKGKTYRFTQEINAAGERIRKTEEM